MTTLATIKERPILFSGQMVRALLGGKKTQTRRLIKQQPDDRGLRTTNVPFEDWHGQEVKCPYGQPGDRLWVKESFVPPHPVFNPGGMTPSCYRATNRFPEDLRWKSPLFMPRAYSRILLEVTAVRAEQLWSMSEQDAIAEGVTHTRRGWADTDDGSGGLHATAKTAYRSLWMDINSATSWHDNSWVWVVEFTVISTTCSTSL